MGKQNTSKQRESHTSEGVIRLSVLAKAAEKWIQELATALYGFSGMEIDAFENNGNTAQILFIDGTQPGWEVLLEKTNRRGKALFLIVPETEVGVPEAFCDGRVDDVLVHPFRAIEVLSKVRHYRQILAWDEVRRLNASFSDMVHLLQSDLQLAERLQKAKLPVRFTDIKGFKVSHRYLAGMRSGGDHFDLADAKESHQLSILLSDSSSYGLSSAVLSALMRVTVKLSANETRSCLETVGKIHDELVSTLKPKDKLSLFYGNVARKDFRLRYLNLGSSRGFYCAPQGTFKELPTQGDSLTLTGGYQPGAMGELTLEAGSRLVLVSDGFLDAVGGVEAVKTQLDHFRDREAVDALNDWVFAVKSKFTEPDDLPEQDCTAVVFDVDANLIRLA